jgi:glycine betaine/proline transport system permease protein
MLIGIPLGILASRSNTFEIILRPILDIMQTIPSFVYLIPVVMLFGVGLTPGVVATIIFALHQ